MPFAGRKQEARLTGLSWAVDMPTVHYVRKTVNGKIVHIAQVKTGTTNPANFKYFTDPVYSQSGKLLNPTHIGSPANKVAAGTVYRTTKIIARIGPTGKYVPAPSRPTQPTYPLGSGTAPTATAGGGSGAAAPSATPNPPIVTPYTRSPYTVQAPTPMVITRSSGTSTSSSSSKWWLIGAIVAVGGGLYLWYRHNKQQGTEAFQ